MNDKLTMTELYNKLEKLGFSKEFIRAIGLPSWWVDELDQSTNISVVYEAASYIAKRLLIDITQEAKLSNNVTYEELLEALKRGKEYLLKLKELGIDVLSNDTVNHFEQLLLLELD